MRKSLLNLATLVLAMTAARPSAGGEQPSPGATPAVPPADGIWRFDFGSVDSPCATGWYSVRPDTRYSPERRFGYTKDRPVARTFDQNRKTVRDRLVLDDVTRDGNYGGAPVRIDLPNGRYRVVVLTGQYSRPGANRPDSHFRKYSVKAAGAVVYAHGDSAEEFLDPRGRYFHNYHRDWHPEVNLYRENIANWIPFGESEVAVKDGHLLVEASHYAPINALWVFPAGNQAGEAALAAFREEQESAFNKQYPYLGGEPEHSMPELGGGAKGAGAVLYVHQDAGRLRPATRPIAWDLGRPLRLFASRGEREAGVVAVTPLRDLQGKVELTSSDLRGSGNARIPATAFDVRYIRYGEYPVAGGYVVKPHFLVPWHPDRLEKGITRGFWVDLHVPEGAEPGFYSGKLTLAADHSRADIAIEVRILPLSLPLCRLRAGVYAGDLCGTTFRHFRTMRKLPYELVRKVMRNRMQFLADQGFTGLYDSLPWYPLEYENGKVTTTEETWNWYLDVFRAAKSIPNFRDRIFCYYFGGPQLFPKCPHFLSLRKADKMPVEDIQFSDEAIREMTTMLQFLYGKIREEKLPELTFYVFDELGNHRARGARWGREMLKALNRCRKDVPGGFRTCVSTLRSSIAREYLPHADIVMPNSAYPVNEKTLEEIRAYGCTPGLYNLGATRFSYGFYPWRVGAYTRAQWSFSYDGDSRDPYVALPAGARGSCDCRYTPDWEVLPSIGMLKQREGVDDYRYVQLLEEHLKTATKGGRTDDAAIRQAQKVLADLRQEVKATYLAPANKWDKSMMDHWRWRVAEAAMALGKK